MKIPIQAGLFTWPDDQPQLIGSRCTSCGEVAFPVQEGCARCGGNVLEDEQLPTSGTLWSYTIQRFPPKEPYRGDVTAFEPYGVGYVDLDGKVLVESRLKLRDGEELRIGATMALCLDALAVDESGAEVVTFAFEAVGS